MKRRNFLSGLAASAGAAALPLPVLAKAAVRSTAKVIPFHYGWASVFARSNNGISATDLQRVFKISASDASGLMDRMVTRGVLYPPGLDGRSHPTRTWEPRDQSAPANTQKAEDLSDNNSCDQSIGTRARQKFARMLAKMKSDPHYAQYAYRFRK